MNACSLIANLVSASKMYASNCAVHFPEKTLTYAELDTRSLELASCIKNFYQDTYNKELKKGSLIGIYLERSPELIIAIYAILRLGCTYVPINTDYPKNRIQHIFEDANLEICITQISLNSKFSSYVRQIRSDALLIELDDKLFLNSYKNSPLILNSFYEESLPIYLMYTSGSTGRPKGVLVSQKSVLNLIESQKKLFSLSPDCRVLNFANCSFDASVWEIFVTLHCGATLCMAPEEKILPGDILAKTLDEYKVTHVTLPPSALLATPAENINTVKYVISAGEACTSRVISKWLSQDRKFFNAYGPTEATVCATIAECKLNEPIHIGNPLENIEVWLLNDAIEQVSQGDIGEICIAGQGLSLGYYKQPALTKKSFVFYKPAANSLVYKTGDLARYTDGRLEYIGRKDDQIKLRGFRIELGHIEALLVSHPQIKQAKVVVKKHLDNELLAAYCLLQANEKEINEKEVKSYLSNYIPYYMIPSVIVGLNELPLDHNGKINKTKLIEREIVVEIEKVDNDCLREALIFIWKTVLGAKSINGQDDFFEIGGHSLLVAQIILMIKEKINVDVTVAEFFDTSKFDDLYVLVKNKNKIIENTNILPTLEIDSQSLHFPFPLTPIQQAYYLGRSGYFDLSNISTNIYREFIFEQLDISKLEESLNKLIRRHNMLHAVIISSQEQKILKEPPFYKIQIYNFTDLPESAFKKHLFLLRDEMSTNILPADKAPILDVRVTLTKDKFYLHCVLDALVVDGWSFYIFFKEWEEIYQGRFATLPDLELNFRDYVIAEQKINQTKQYAEDKSYWHNQIENMPLGPNLPIKTHPTEVISQPSKTIRTIINEDVWSKICALVDEMGVTKTTLLLSIYAEILNHWSSTKQFVINMTIFNRLPMHAQVNQIIGDFTSLELFQVDFSGGSTISFLERLKKNEARLYMDLDHRLYSGIEIQRDKARLLKSSLSSALMPIVFTCFMKNGNDKDQLSKMFSFKNLSYGSTQSSQVWLDYKAYEEDNQLIVEWDYISEIFPEKMMTQMHEAYCQLILHLAENKEYWYKTSFSLLPSSFMQDKFEKAPQTTFPFAQDLIITNAQKYPDHPALIFNENVLSYAQLVSKSLNLAAHIKEISANKKPEIVALFYKRGTEQVVAMLSVLMSGKAYLPIDITLPINRINEILYDASPSIFLTTSDFKPILLELNYLKRKENNVSTILTDEEIKIEATICNCYEQATLQPNDLAYIIYTSGSSGKPKGVMIEHFAMMNTLLDVNARYTANKQDKILAISNYSFDLSVYDIFGLLIAGGTVVLIDEEQSKEPAHWEYLLQKNKITIWNSVPIIAQLLITHLSNTKNTQALESLRLCLLSGDWIPLNLPRELNRLHPRPENLKIISLGGATECSIWSIFYEIQDILPDWKSIPYGRGMTNQNVYVLDDNLEICPQWVTGNIYISGHGLARGYWNDLEKTKKHFMLHPKNGIRLYYTGDLGRYIEDSVIEFLGRVDSQIKLSGHRIELGEIESVLIKHPLINQAIIELHTQATKKQILAYITTINRERESNLLEKSDLKNIEEMVNFKKQKLNIESIVNNSNYYEININGTDFKKRHKQMKTIRCFKGQNFHLEMLEKLVKGIKPAIKNLDEFTCLEKILACFAARYDEKKDSLVYLYPSAGSLYPVQVYLKNNCTALPIKKGYHYYHPLERKLYLIKSLETETPSEKIELFFVMKLSAMLPLYADLTKRFCFLEIGHMLACAGLPLDDTPNIKSHLIDDRTEMNDFSSLLQKDPNYRSLFTVSLTFNKYTSEANQIDKCLANISCILFVKPKDYVDNNGAAGWFEYTQDKGFIPLNINLNLTIADFFGNNQIIYHESHFIFFFLANPTENIETSYLYAGYFAQYMQMNALEKNIGLCPIGEVSNHVMEQIENSTNKRVIYSYMGGNITPEQIDDEDSSLPNDSLNTNSSSLKKYLEQALPDYMIPSDFIIIDKIPLTPNGKVDRNTLKELGEKFKVNNSGLQLGPRNSLEKLIANYWQKVLETPITDINESFRYYGGNSLTLLKLANVLGLELGIDISLIDLIRNDTIAKQAICITLLKEKAIRRGASLVVEKEESMAIV